jgi:chaperonin GroEL
MALEGMSGSTDDRTRGIQIVRSALSAPLRQIVENAGQDGGVVVGNLIEGGNSNMGYNAQTERYEDMVAAGVLDPTLVVRSALQDAASVAGLLLTTEVAIVEAAD